jgi:hypothetical protein
MRPVARYKLAIEILDRAASVLGVSRLDLERLYSQLSPTQKSRKPEETVNINCRRAIAGIIRVSGGWQVRRLKPIPFNTTFRDLKHGEGDCFLSFAHSICYLADRWRDCANLLEGWPSWVNEYLQQPGEIGSMGVLGITLRRPHPRMELERTAPKHNPGLVALSLAKKYFVNGKSISTIVHRDIIDSEVDSFLHRLWKELNCVLVLGFSVHGAVELVPGKYFLRELSAIQRDAVVKHVVSKVREQCLSLA